MLPIKSVNYYTPINTNHINKSLILNNKLTITKFIKTMAPNSFIITIVALFLAISKTAWAGDPDILSDFIIPENSTSVTSDFFTYTGLRTVLGNTPQNLTVSKASLKEFPGLDGESVSLAVLQFPAGAVNPLHTHPRSAELLFLIDGILEVGFVDTENVFYSKTLKVGDLFVFPKGLVHYQYNRNHKHHATAISAFGSASAGTVSVPLSVFATGIDDETLALSFHTDVATVQKIKAGL